MKQSVGSTQASQRRRRRRWPVVTLASVTVLAAVFYLGGGWYFSGHLYQQALSGAAKRAAKPTYNLSVAAVTPGTVTLRIPTDPGQLLTPGVWGIQWPTGYGQVTTIVARGDRTVTRDFRQVTGSPLVAGTRVALDNKAFPNNPSVAWRSPSTTSPIRARWARTRRGLFLDHATPGRSCSTATRWTGWTRPRSFRPCITSACRC